MIDKNTKLYGSFSIKAGSVGCRIFNTSFKYDNINAIYKSFSIENIEDAVKSAKCLSFSGFAVSMPFKSQIIKFLDETDEIVKKVGTCNTVLIKDNRLIGYNTDYLAIESFLNNVNDLKFIYILGNGCYSKNVQYYCNQNNINFKIIDRKIWNEILSIKNSIIFNCTPVDDIKYDKSNFFIDCINTSNTGNKLAKLQASIQYKIYTGLKFPLSID